MISRIIRFSKKKIIQENLEISNKRKKFLVIVYNTQRWLLAAGYKRGNQINKSKSSLTVYNQSGKINLLLTRITHLKTDKHLEFRLNRRD